MTEGLILDPVATSRVHIVPREARSSDIPASVVVHHWIEEEESSPISLIGVLIVEAFGMKLNMQSLVIMMHGSEK